MNKTLENPLDSNLEEWEILPDNTSFFQFGLHEIQDLISNEIIYADYFIQQPNLIQQTEKSHDQDEEESQFKNISISHIFFNNINQSADEEQQQLIESTRSGSEREIEAAAPASVLEEKVSFGGKGELEEGMWIGRWRVIGVGALFSIGAAAAATICVVVLGGGREGKQGPCRRRRQQRNIVRFFSHDEDKGVNRVVEQASRLNQALAAARGTPTMIRTAKISFGGCYDGL